MNGRVHVCALINVYFCMYMCSSFGCLYSCDYVHGDITYLFLYACVSYMHVFIYACECFCIHMYIGM